MKKKLILNNELKQAAFAIKWRSMKSEIDKDIFYEKHNKFQEIAWKVLKKSLRNKTNKIMCEGGEKGKRNNVEHAFHFCLHVFLISFFLFLLLFLFSRCPLVLCCFAIEVSNMIFWLEQSFSSINILIPHLKYCLFIIFCVRL